LFGRTHDLTATRTQRIIRICERHGIPVLADSAYSYECTQAEASGAVMARSPWLCCHTCPVLPAMSTGPTGLDDHYRPVS
jgi:hypothetical protein